MTRALCTITLATLIAGCCTPGEPVGSDYKTRCKDSGTITLKLHVTGISVMPANICARPGQTIRVKIKGNPELKSNVRSKFKGDRGDRGDSRDHWLDRSNKKHPDRFEFRVPGAERFSASCLDGDGCDLYYLVEVDGVGRIDPMIRVRR